MQNQTDSARSAKPQEPRLARRVAASFNQSLQAMPGFAVLFALALCPGMPEPKRSA
jgi:hypothetical protein